MSIFSFLRLFFSFVLKNKQKKAAAPAVPSRPSPRPVATGVPFVPAPLAPAPAPTSKTPIKQPRSPAPVSKEPPRRLEPKSPEPSKRLEPKSPDPSRRPEPDLIQGETEYEYQFVEQLKQEGGSNRKKGGNLEVMFVRTNSMTKLPKFTEESSSPKLEQAVVVESSPPKPEHAIVVAEEIVQEQTVQLDLSVDVDWTMVWSFLLIFFFLFYFSIFLG